MDFEKRASEALKNLDAPYNELLLRLRNFCMLRGIVLKQKDVDELGDIVAGLLGRSNEEGYGNGNRHSKGVSRWK